MGYRRLPLMKISIITRRIPPTHCGIGDYTAQLAKELIDQGHEVTVLCGSEQANTLPDNRIRVRNIVGSWGILGMRSLLRELSIRRPELLIINWVPHLYSPRGTSLWLPMALLLVNRKKTKIHLVVHETWAAFADPLSFFTGPFQRLSLAILVGVSAAVLVSVQPWVTLLKNMFFWKSNVIHWLPVGSNVPVVPFASTERETLRRRFGIASQEVAIGVFSLQSAGKGFDYISESMRALAKSGVRCHWVFIGATEEEFVRHFPQHKEVSHNCTGYLANEQVSRWLQCLDLCAAPFIDGASPRRGSLIAALAHGVPTASTIGNLTDTTFFKKSPLILSSLDPVLYADKLVRAAKDLRGLREQRPLTREFYKSHFRWKDIAYGILSPSKVPIHSALPPELHNKIRG